MPNRTNNLARDASSDPIQIGGSFQTLDATGTPQNSPLSYTTGVITIVVPDNALELIVNPSTSVRVSEDPTMATYDIVLGGSKESIPCARMTNVYIKRDVSSGTLNFRFTLI